MDLLSGVCTAALTVALLSKMYRKGVPVQSERVAVVEERCVDLKDPLKYLGSKHCFMVLISESGEKTRMEAVRSNSDIDISYHYAEIAPNELYRRAQVKNNLSVADAVGLFRERCAHDRSGHDCQYITRDVFNEISQNFSARLRNQYLRDVEWKLRGMNMEVTRPDSLHDEKGHAKYLKLQFSKLLSGGLPDVQSTDTKKQELLTRLGHPNADFNPEEFDELMGLIGNDRE